MMKRIKKEKQLKIDPVYAFSGLLMLFAYTGFGQTPAVSFRAEQIALHADLVNGNDCVQIGLFYTYSDTGTATFDVEQINCNMYYDTAVANRLFSGPPIAIMNPFALTPSTGISNPPTPISGSSCSSSSTRNTVSDGSGTSADFPAGTGTVPLNLIAIDDSKAVPIILGQVAISSFCTAQNGTESLFAILEFRLASAIDTGTLHIRFSNNSNNLIQKVGTTLHAATTDGAIRIHRDNIWQGSSNTLWTDATNWTKGQVPSTTDYVIIPDVSSASGNFPSLSANTGVGSIHIEANASLSINTGNTLRIYYIWENYGTVSGNGTVQVNSTSLTQLSGTSSSSFGAIEIDNPDGTHISDGASINCESLTIKSGASLTTGINSTLHINDGLQNDGDFTIKGVVYIH